MSWVAVGAIAGLLVLAAIAAVLARRAEPFMRAQIIQALQKRFHARVELDTFHIALGNELRGQWGIWAEGKGLRIWPSDESEAAFGEDERAQAEAVARDEPLIRIDEFSFHAPLRYTRGKPVVISVVKINGVNILVPPKAHPEPGTGNTNLAANQPAQDAEKAAANTLNQMGTKDQAAKAGFIPQVLVERVECKNANLVLETNQPGKLPLGFAISRIVLTGITPSGPVGFEADLTNPRPLGEIHTTGSFGPWLNADPGNSAVSGDYRFDHADLSGFKGIAGTLNSTGHYEGTLRNIVVDGVTDTPDFQLTHFGSPMHLQTKFHATVDGTDGDTWLDPVDATLGQSRFTARGKIVRLRIGAPAQQSKTATGAQEASVENLSAFRGGHDIALNVNIDRARIEDFLRLANHATSPLLTGDVKVRAKLHIPPGPAPIHERLQLAGNFQLDKVLFTSTKIQDRVEQLSLRGQGRTRDLKTADPSTIDSSMQSDFQIAGGIIKFPNLDYTVPGAEIQLAGTYGMEGGSLDFAGTAKLQATVSQIVGGWKGVLLKPADHFFKKNGAGTQLAIHVSGTREDPKFGVDLGKSKSTSPERPGAK